MSQRPALTNNRLQAVRVRIAALSDLTYALHTQSAEEDLDTCAEAAWAVFEALRDLTRPKPVTGCQQHPTGPIDPLYAEEGLPAGWGRCLLCNISRRRGTRSEPRRPR